MHENRRFFIRVNGNLVPVSEEVYRAYYQARRHERYLEEKDAAHGLVHYAAFDTHHSTGEEELRDHEVEGVAETAMRHVMAERLRGCLDSLSTSEKAMIWELFFHGKTERQYASETGMSQQKLHARKRVILAKLKKLLETRK